jgi:hypothetical protein
MKILQVIRVSVGVMLMPLMFLLWCNDRIVSCVLFNTDHARFITWLEPKYLLMGIIRIAIFWIIYGLISLIL